MTCESDGFFHIKSQLVWGGREKKTLTAQSGNENASLEGVYGYFVATDHLAVGPTV